MRCNFENTFNNLTAGPHRQFLRFSQICLVHFYLIWCGHCPDWRRPPLYLSPLPYPREHLRMCAPHGIRVSACWISYLPRHEDSLQQTNEGRSKNEF